MAYAFITCLDSSLDVAGLARTSPRLDALRHRGRVVGKGILVSTRNLLTLNRRARLFFGFDEVWFFSHARITAKPKGLVITGPNRISEEALPSLTRWMQRHGGSLGLGDGTGMNFCARLQGVARHLVDALGEPVSNGQIPVAAGLSE